MKLDEYQPIMEHYLYSIKRLSIEDAQEETNQFLWKSGWSDEEISKMVDLLFKKAGYKRVLITRVDGRRQHYWVSPDKLEEKRRKVEEQGGTLEVTGEEHGWEHRRFKRSLYGRIRYYQDTKQRDMGMYKDTWDTKITERALTEISKIFPYKIRVFKVNICDVFQHQNLSSQMRGWILMYADNHSTGGFTNWATNEVVLLPMSEAKRSLYERFFPNEKVEETIMFHEIGHQFWRKAIRKKEDVVNEWKRITYRAPPFSNFSMIVAKQEPEEEFAESFYLWLKGRKEDMGTKRTEFFEKYVGNAKHPVISIDEAKRQEAEEMANTTVAGMTKDVVDFRGKLRYSVYIDENGKPTKDRKKAVWIEDVFENGRVWFVGAGN